MPRIVETIVTTTNAKGEAHIAPLGLIEDGDNWIIAPFRPSRTLDNLNEVPYAVASHTDDVRVFAGCVTGRKDWPTRPAARVPGVMLADAVSHWELAVARVTDDAQRPRYSCSLVHEASNRPWEGFNRAQAAVLECAVLVTRLKMLPPEKIDAELKYLEIAIAKTAGRARGRSLGLADGKDRRLPRGSQLDVVGEQGDGDGGCAARRPIAAVGRGCGQRAEACRRAPEQDRQGLYLRCADPGGDDRRARRQRRCRQHFLYGGANLGDLSIGNLVGAGAPVVGRRISGIATEAAGEARDALLHRGAAAVECGMLVDVVRKRAEDAAHVGHVGEAAGGEPLLRARGRSPAGPRR